MYFSYIGSILPNKIPKRYQNRTIYTNLLGVVGGNHRITQFEHIYPIEVVKVIQSLDNNTSSGLDGINTKSLKSLSPMILEELTNCINTCLINLVRRVIQVTITQNCFFLLSPRFLKGFCKVA